MNEWSQGTSSFTLFTFLFPNLVFSFQLSGPATHSDALNFLLLICPSIILQGSFPTLLRTPQCPLTKEKKKPSWVKKKSVIQHNIIDNMKKGQGVELLSFKTLPRCFLITLPSFASWPRQLFLFWLTGCQRWFLTLLLYPLYVSFETSEYNSLLYL